MMTNIAMENGPCIDGLPIENGDFPWLCSITRWYVFFLNKNLLVCQRAKVPSVLDALDAIHVRTSNGLIQGMTVGGFSQGSDGTKKCGYCGYC